MDTNRKNHPKVIIGYSIVSPLHLINFLTYLRSCEEVFHEKYLFISNYWGSSIIPQRYIDYCEQKNIKVIFNETEKDKILNNLLKSKLNICLVFVKSPNLYLLKKSFSKNVEDILIIDEGLSSYAGFFHSFKATFREKNIKGIFKILLYIVIVKFLQIFLQHKIHKFTAFHGEYINPTYKKNFLEVLKNMNISRCEYEIREKSILFCTQPLIEIGLMSYIEYEKMISEVRAICKSNNILLLIKKHPVDKIFNYSNYNIVDFDGVVEELVATQENIIGTISSSSTSSLLISACMNKESYIISFNNFSKMDSNLKKLFQRYCKSIEKINDIN